MTKPCQQTSIAIDNTPLTCNEFYSTECVIHKDALVELGLEENSNLYSIINAFLNAIINLNSNQGSGSGGTTNIEVQNNGAVVSNSTVKLNFINDIQVELDNIDIDKVNIGVTLPEYTLGLSDSNVLSISRDSNIISTVNLTDFLDDTNSSRIVSGNLESNNLVFTRDDSSSFSIDVSDLVSQSEPSVISGEIVGTDLILTKSDSSTVIIDISNIEQSQTLSINGTTLSISGGNSVIIPTGGTGTNNYYNTIFRDRSEQSLIGNVDGINRVFVNSQGQYTQNTTKLRFEGLSLIDSQGYLESNPSIGEITFDEAPTVIDYPNGFVLEYQIGSVNSNDTGQPDQTISIVNDELRLTRTGQTDSTVDLSPYSGGGGGASRNYEIVVSTSYTVPQTSRWIEAQTDNTTFTLPTVNNFDYVLINASKTDLTVTNQINGQTNRTIPAGESMTVIYNSVEYKII